VYWATASSLLAEFESGAISLFPPTHRTLELLSGCETLEETRAVASDSNLAVICPRFLVENGQPVLALPGDPAHELAERCIAGSSRYVLRDARWVSNNEAILPG
jgi:hypothetical protein